MPYKVWADTDVLNAADVNAMTADAVKGTDIETAETTTSTSYVALATAGPSVSINLVAGQGCLVFVEGRLSVTSGGSGHQAFMGFGVTGASSQGASDADSAQSQNVQADGASRTCWFVATNTGSHTFTALYKVTSGDTATFAHRRILVKKF